MENEKKIKKTYSEDYVGAILEEIKGDFKVFGEGLNIVQKGVKNLEVEVGGLKEKIDKMDIRLGSVEEKVGAMDIRLGSVEEKVDFLVEDMDEVKANIVDIKIDIKEINGKLDGKVDTKITDDHEKRIFKLEKATQGV